MKITKSMKGKIYLILLFIYILFILITSVLFVFIAESGSSKTTTLGAWLYSILYFTVVLSIPVFFRKFVLKIDPKFDSNFKAAYKNIYIHIPWLPLDDRNRILFKHPVSLIFFLAAILYLYFRIISLPGEVHLSTLLITVVPSILILLYFFLSDRFREPVGLIALTFIWGTIICIPAGELNVFMRSFSTGSKLDYALYGSFFGPAWTEELLKFLVIYFLIFKNKAFNEPMDGIVYGVTVSLGFATFENYEYVFYVAEIWNIDPQQMAIMRSYSAVPMHGLNGCIMGYFIAAYAFTGIKKYLVLSLLIPYLLHGSYNFLCYFLPQNNFYLLIVGIMLIFSFILHSKLKKYQKTMNEEGELEKKY